MSDSQQILLEILNVFCTPPQKEINKTLLEWREVDYRESIIPLHQQGCPPSSEG
jgi:hypothetical protein